MSRRHLRNILASLIITAFTFDVSVAQESFHPKDSISHNHYLKLNVFALLASLPYHTLYLSLQYEGRLSNHQTYGLGTDLWNSDFWLRPQWRYYFGQSFKGFYVGAMVTYVHDDQSQYTDNYMGFGAMTGFQLIASSRFLLELNYRLSRQFSIGETYYGNDQFNLGTIELNLGYGIGKKKKVKN